MNNKCIFCNKVFNKESEIILENNLHYSKWEKNPVTKGHVLIISKRHINSIFDLTKKEFIEIQEILSQTKDIVDKKYKPEGYNIGINQGKVAGQTIPHLHIHLIPRYSGDVENPIGGVRNVISGKGNYLK